MIGKIFLLIFVSQSGILAVTFIASNYQKSTEDPADWGAATLFNRNRGSVVACGLECAQTPDCFHYKFDTAQILRCILYIEPTRLVPPADLPITAVRMVASRWENGDFVMQVPTTGITYPIDAYNTCIQYGFRLPPPPITAFDWHVLQGYPKTLLDVKGVHPVKPFFNFNGDDIVESPEGPRISFLKDDLFPIVDEIYCGVATLSKINMMVLCNDRVGIGLRKRLVCIK